jgi:hypothetical protein
MTQAHLRPCPSCERHVRVNEGGCPFCGVQFTDAFRAGPRPHGPTARLSRAALFAFGTGTLALAPGCSSSSSVPTPAYGAPAMVEDAGDDGATTVPDGSTEASTPVPDSGPPMAQPAYGIAVPIEDASDDHHVGVTPLYGIAPGN